METRTLSWSLSCKFQSAATFTYKDSMPWFRPPQPQGQEGKHWINFMWLVQSAVGGVGDTIMIIMIMMMMTMIMRIMMMMMLMLGRNTA